MRMIGAARATCVILSGIFAVGAVLVADVGAMGAVSPNARQTTEQTVPVGAFTRMKVSNIAGAIVVVGRSDASDIQVSATRVLWGRTPRKAEKALTGLRIGINPRGDLLEIRPEHSENWNQIYEVIYHIVVPANFRVEASTTSGAVRIRGVREVDVASVSGDVLVSRVGSIKVRTESGAVEVDSTAGPLDLGTMSGAVRGRMMGRIASARITTTSGQVLLKLPDDANADLSVTTSGSLVTVEGLQMRDASQNHLGTRGTIGRGGVPIEVTSNTGMVTITSRATAFSRAIDVSARQSSAPATETAPAANEGRAAE